MKMWDKGVLRDMTPAEIAELEAAQAAPPPVPTVISRRQLILALHGVGMITADEALAAAKTGDVPAAIGAVFDLLPAKQALAARITWATMTEVHRNDPLIAAIISAGVASAEQVDDLFRAAAVEARLPAVEQTVETVRAAESPRL